MREILRGYSNALTPAMTEEGPIGADAMNREFIKFVESIDLATSRVSSTAHAATNPAASFAQGTKYIEFGVTAAIHTPS